MKPRRPCVAITITSASIFFSAFKMEPAGSPVWIRSSYLSPAKPLVCDLEQLGASSLFLPLVEIHVDRHPRRLDDHRNYVQDEDRAIALAGEIGGGIERLHRVIVEIHRAKDFAELRLP